MENFSDVFRKFLIAGLNQARCLMRKIIIPLKIESFLRRIFRLISLLRGSIKREAGFTRLTVLSTALFNQPAFKNVIVNGLVLAENGAKMSKRLKNYPDPLEVIHQYGADAIRLYLLHSPAVKAEDLSFSKAGVELVLRQILIPLWNAYSFFVTYARIYQWKPTPLPEPLSQVIDRWIVSLVNKLIHEVEEGMDDYDLARAVEPFVGFIDQLTNWYIRRSRRRFWEEEDTPGALASVCHVVSCVDAVGQNCGPLYAVYERGDLSESSREGRSSFCASL